MDHASLVAFYDRAYSSAPADAARYTRWRALGAVGKADHVVSLCRRVDLRPASILEIGCGNGALLSELHARGFGGRLAGVEITAPAVEIAQAREAIDTVELFDGERLAYPDGAFELGILSHVLEHVPEPPSLLAEAARVCRAVAVEVPLEDNLSARRASRREHASEVGHLHRLGRAGARRIVHRAGLEVAAEIEDPLPRPVHRFFATSRRERLSADAKWALRAGLHGLAPPLARRAFTVHWSCLARPPGA